MRTGPAKAPVGDKKPGVFRVLFLGTSYAFVWCSEYEESYAAPIGAGLAQRGLDVEVLNLGTPAQTAGPQLCWPRENARRIRPVVVIQTVFANPSVLAGSWTDRGEGRGVPRPRPGRGAIPGGQRPPLHRRDARPAGERRRGADVYWLDTHLTPAGNRVVGDLVLSRLSAVTAPPPPLRGHEGG